MPLWIKPMLIRCQIKLYSNTGGTKTMEVSAFISVRYTQHIEGLVQDCSNSIANALEVLQSCTEPLS